MKKKDFFRLLFLSGLLFPVYAEMPNPGVYGGAFVGLTWSSPISDPLIVPFIELELKQDGFIAELIKRLFNKLENARKGRNYELTYSTFGQFGLELGYRFQSLRIEGEFFYNSSPYQHLNILGGYRDFRFSGNSNQDNYISGKTDIAAGMLNIYYDFLNLPIPNIGITPFVGVGGGYAKITNDLKIYNQGQLINNAPISPNGSHFAGQLMAGLLYFIDEFSTIGLDYRYFTTASETVTLAAGDTTFRNQIQSVNLTYNGSFNFG